MTTKRIGLFFVACLVALSGNATTLSRVSLAELTAHSDLVVYVEVISGKRIADQQSKEGPVFCGAEYEGKILKTLKGDAGTAPLRFGYYTGYGIGNRLVLFLNTKDKLYEPLESSNSMMMHALYVQQVKCSPVWPGLLVNHSGVGALKVGASPAFDYQDAVLVPGRHVKMPAGVKSHPAAVAGEKDYDANVWVRMDDFFAAVMTTK